MYAKEEVWVEKFRPQTLEDVRGNKKEVQRLRDWVTDQSMPNVMLYGPAGSGKTAAAIAFAKDKYDDEWQNHVLQLNASDDRGIEVVRKQIKQFASQGGVMGGHGFNIIVLDEVDHMTRQAQPAMRRVMEDYSDRTRFFLLCNYPNKLIDPIQSRCAPLNMSPLDHSQIQELLIEIADEEEVEYEDNQIRRIVDKADGDARKAIHTLQSSVIEGTLNDDALDALVTMVDRDDIEEIVNLATNGELGQAIELFDNLIADGIGPQMIADEMDDVVQELDLPEDSKSLLFDSIADFEWRTVNGATPELQGHKLLQDIRVARHLSFDNYGQETSESV